MLKGNKLLMISLLHISFEKLTPQLYSTVIELSFVQIQQSPQKVETGSKLVLLITQEPFI